VEYKLSGITADTEKVTYTLFADDDIILAEMEHELLSACDSSGKRSRGMKFTKNLHLVSRL
jgi:hypothetical protein